MPKIMVNRYLNFSCTMPGIFASLPCDMTISSQNFPFIFPSKTRKKMKVDYIPKKQYIKISPKNNILTAQVELS